MMRGCRRSILLLLATVKAWRSEGELPAGKNLQQSWFVGKFIFDVNAEGDVLGDLRLDLHGMVNEGLHSQTASPPEVAPCWGSCETQGNWYFMMFDDESEHWKAIHENWEEQSCEKLKHYSSDAWQPLLQKPAAAWSRKVGIKEKIRPRLWYFLFVACNVTMPLPVSYSIHTRNILFGMQEELGFDLLGMPKLQTMAALTFASFAIVGHFLAGSYRVRPLLLLLVLACAISAAQSAGLAWHYWCFLRDGFGFPSLEVLSALLGALTKAVLLFMLILATSSWSFWSSKRSFLLRIAIGGALSLMAILTLVCEFQEAYEHDTSAALQLYTSEPGRLRLILQCGLFCGAATSLFMTGQKEESLDLQDFYLMLTGAFGIYFTVLPVQVVLAHLVSPWWRLWVVTLVDVISKFVVFSCLMAILRPSRTDLLLHARLEETEVEVTSPDHSERAQAQADWVATAAE